MATGTVKVWSKSNGFGWIQPDSRGDRVYVHKSGVERQDPNRAASLAIGDRVEFSLGQRPKGSAAVNVRLLTGEAAQTGPTNPATAESATDADASE